MRDRTALIEALDGLEKRFSGEVDSPSFAVLRTALELKRQAAIETQGSADEVASDAVKALKEGRMALDALVLGRKERRSRPASSPASRPTTAVGGAISRRR